MVIGVVDDFFVWGWMDPQGSLDLGVQDCHAIRIGLRLWIMQQIAGCGHGSHFG